MQLPDHNQNSRDTDPAWCFLTELPLSEWMGDGETEGGRTPDLLLQTIHDLGVPTELLKNIAWTLAGFAEEAMPHSNQGRGEMPGYIRLFCQKKLIEDGISAKTSSDWNADPTEKVTPLIHHSGIKMKGGWGFFFVERGGRFPADSSVSCRFLVDLYLYKEGE